MNVLIKETNHSTNIQEESCLYAREKYFTVQPKKTSPRMTAHPNYPFAGIVKANREGEDVVPPTSNASPEVEVR